jgi:hypothetical protein
VGGERHPAAARGGEGGVACPHHPGQPAVPEHGPGQDGQVVGGRAVAAGVEAMGVAPGGAAQGQQLGLGVHGPGEPGHRPSGRLGQHHRHVVGGHDHQGLQGLVDGEPLAAPSWPAGGPAAGPTPARPPSSRPCRGWPGRPGRSASWSGWPAGPASGSGGSTAPPRWPGRPGSRTWPGPSVPAPGPAAAPRRPGRPVPGTARRPGRRRPGAVGGAEAGRVRRMRMAAAVSHPVDEPDKVVGPVTEGPTCL